MNFPSVRSCDLPDGALLAAYRLSGDYTDCYAIDVPGRHSHASYLRAFYTTWVFKLERLILKLVLDKVSTDAQIAELAAGERDEFAVWRVEGRCENQLLLTDVYGRTRSWLMLAPVASAQGPATRLYFGSAVVAERDPRRGGRRMARSFSLLLGFHKLYSRVLLAAARSRLVALDG